MKERIILLILSVVLFSCSSGHSILNDDFEITENTSLYILPVQMDSIKIKNEEGILYDLNIDSDSLYEHLKTRIQKQILSFKKAFNKKITVINKEIKNENFDIITNQQNTFHVREEVSKFDEVSVNIPKKEILGSFGINPQLIIVISSIELLAKIESGNGLKSSPIGLVHGSDSGPIYLSKINFVIWDYKNDKMVKMGTELMKTQKNGWDGNFKEMIIQMIENTPLANEYLKRD